MLQQHSAKGITLRNDNGSQFIAHVVREYLKEQAVEQEFIHVATPQENCFIEAYHSILEKQLLETVEFEDIEEALAVFNRWKIFYNERRRHGSLGQCPPKEVWDAYEKTNFAWVRRSGRGLRQGCNPPEIA
jgi:transposase InsO family protein